MEEYQEEISKIRVLLGSHPEGLSITDISSQLQMNRNSVAKYLDILRIQGAVDGRKRGTSKVYYHSQRLLASSVRRICTQPMVMVNEEGMVVDFNASFSVISSVPEERILGQHVDTLPVKILEGGNARQVTTAAIKGIEQRVRIQVLSGNTVTPATMLLLPVVFDTSRPGVALIIEKDTDPGSSGTDLTTTGIPGLVENQVEYTVHHTPEGIILHVNEPYCRAAGKTREDLVGRQFAPLVSAEDTERIRVHRSRLTPQYPLGRIEYRAVMADGDARWQRWWDRALFNERNELTGFVSSGIDITDLVETRQKLTRTKETLEESINNRTDELRGINRQLYTEMTRREKIEQQLLHTQFAMDHAADMVFRVSRNARIHYANAAATEGSGYAPETILTLTLGEIFPYFTLPQWDDVWETLKHSGALTTKTDLVSESGRAVPVEMAINYLEYHGIEFAFCFARDILERVRNEHALQLANKKLSLVSSITRHDIQNKITVLLGFLGRAKKREQDPVILMYMEKQERAAKAIRNEINLTRDFKDVGAEPPGWISVNEVVTLAIHQFPEAPVRFTATIPEVEVYADRNLLRVFSRLFEFLLHYGQGTTIIECSATETDAHLQITVSDHGGGIVPEEKESIFSVQEDESGYRELFFAREILSLTGITLRETGVYGTGARFEMTVPPGTYRFVPP
ncbi:MAG: PAS domain S-box protein [Methanoregula sp.]